jgi:hypothetical protein
MVAMFDVLGFKSLRERLGIEGIYQRYEKLAAFIREPKSGIDLVPIQGFVVVGHLNVHCAYFSDTILFWARYAFPALRSFCNTCSEAMCKGVEIGLPLRGGIAVGQAIMDVSLSTYLGQPIEEAHAVEQAQSWIGASFGPSFHDRNSFFLDTILPYRAHRKTDSGDLIRGCVLDWPRHWRGTRTSSLSTVVKALDRDPKYSDKYSATLKFVDFSESNHDWFIKQKHLDYG